jgi:UDP-N-acetylmuramoylalanine--D-glutamate ligase
MKPSLTNKKVLVLGLGDTGLSMARWLARQGARVSVADSRESPPHAERLKAEVPGAVLFAGPFREQPFLDAELIAISPGVPVREPLVAAAIARGVPVVGDIELFAQALADRAKVIAITGANGKSTVTEMAGAMCRAAGCNTVVAGNIGLPVLDALAEAEDKGQLPEVFVLELSSFQLETTASLNPAAATVLNVTEDHLDRYDGMGDYAAAKARIFAGDGVQVLNREDRYSLAMARPGRTVVTFGLDMPRGGDWGLLREGGEAWLAQGDKKILAVRELKVAGLHNAANALAALALSRAIGLPLEPLLQALREFKGLPHRVERVAEIRGVTFYDDSKGTNVGATEAALRGMAEPVVLIAGGDGKGQDFTPLRDAVAGKARAVVLIGRDGDKIGRAIEGSGVPLLKADTMEEAVRESFVQARPGDAVLLSPACASFDMFRSYAHRAEVFIAAVHELAKETAA